MRQERCPARAKTYGKELISPINNHTHGLDPTRKDVIQVTSAIKRRVTETREPTQQIISTAVSKNMKKKLKFQTISINCISPKDHAIFNISTW
jgi:hypothetical protein